jgi:aminoglycoside phosphotransferase (APT) family kinase protein
VGGELDWEVLVPYLQVHIAGLDGDFSVKQFPNGSANLSYLLRFGTQSLVLRRPSFGRIAPGAHDMKRESRSCRGGGNTSPRAPGPPGPRALHLGTDLAVIGSDSS